MRYVVFALAGAIGIFGIFGLLGEWIAFADAGRTEASGAILAAFGPLIVAVPLLLIVLVFCYWRTKAMLSQNEKLTILAIVAPEVLTILGLATWLLLGNR